VAYITAPLHPKDHLGFFRTQESCLLFLQALLGICRHLGHKCHDDEIPSSLLGPLARTLAANYFTGGEELPADISSQFKAFLDLLRACCYARATSNDKPTGGEGLSISNDYGETILPRINHRRLCVTRKRYLCLVPLNTDVNDSVSILLGGRTPYILRPQGQDFTIIGETYVHGMMKGEALEDPDFQSRVRKIRFL
jgi:hypothetical protein